MLFDQEQEKYQIGEINGDTIGAVPTQPIFMALKWASNSSAAFNDIKINEIAFFGRE